MNDLYELWTQELIPLVDGVILKNGNIYFYDIITYPDKKILFKGESHLNKFLETNPDYYTIYEVFGEVEIDSKHIYFGGGSFGSDGFVMCFCKNTYMPEWLFFSSYINPVQQVYVKNDTFFFKTETTTIKYNLTDNIHLNFIEEHLKNNRG